MICKHCGQETNDNAKFCVKCGQPIEAAETVTNDTASMNSGMPVNNGFNANMPSMSAQQPQKNGKAMMGVIAVVAVIAVILVVVLLLGAVGKNEKTPLNNIEKIFNKKVTDVDKIVEDVTPKFVSTAYKDIIDVLKGNDEYSDYIEDFYEEGEGALEDVWEDLYDEAEDEFGKNVKFSYKIEDKEAVDKDDLKDVVEVYQELGQFKDQFAEIVEIVSEATELEDKEVKKLVKVVETFCDELEGMKISKAYILEVEVTVEGKEDDDSETFDVVVSKMNGSWTIDPLMTAAINSGMDIDEIADVFDDEYKDSLDEFADMLDESIDELEEDIEDVDDDILEMLFDELMSGL